MNWQPFKTPPKWWSPKTSVFWLHTWRPLRHYLRHKLQRLVEIEIRGIDNLRQALDQKQGILITPNHSGHADPLIIYKAADQVSRPFYFMAAWQVFIKVNPVRRLLLRQHGCFSVDREGTDMRAFRQAVDILQNKPYPLVIFPEGEVYHVNDKVTPFRDGPAAIALTASKKAQRPIVCIPCGIKYQYIQDPTPELLELMDRLEDRILWRPRPDMKLVDRIYRFAEGAISLKELEYLGHTQTGSLPDRIVALANEILSRLEKRYNIEADNSSLPGRVKTVRREAITKLEETKEDQQQNQQVQIDLDDLFIITQLFSYPGDYVAGKPTIERMAETLDKFEEDIFRVPTATIRGIRRAVVSFGEPIVIQRSKDKKKSSHTVTEYIEQQVQLLLDDIKPPQRD